MSVRSGPARPGLAPGVVWASVVILLMTVALLPFSMQLLGLRPTFLPAVLAVVTVFDVIGLLLLRGQFLTEGDPRVLALSWAYAWSLVVMLGYALAFPGVVADRAPLGSWPSAAPYLWVSWHAGFPLLLGLALAPWPTRWTATLPRLTRTRAWRVTFGAAVLLGAGVVGLAVVSEGVAPPLIQGLSTARMTAVCGPGMLLCCLLGNWWCWTGARQRSGPERWAPVAVTAVSADVVLTLYSLHRFSLGWYGGRLLTVLAAGIVVVAMLSDAQRTRRELLEQTATLNALLRHADSAISLKDLSGRYLVVNPALARFLGHEPQDLIDKRAADLLPGGEGLALSQVEQGLLESGLPVHQQERHLGQDGDAHTFLANRFVVHDTDGRPLALAGISTDITELVQAKDELAYRASTDSHTGLLNRSALLAALATRLDGATTGQARGGPAGPGSAGALVLFDLDHFKVINDSLGHAAGDLVLAVAARRLVQAADQLPGTLVVRLGGDEFVLLTPPVQPERAHQVVGAALHLLAQPYRDLPGGQTVTTTASAGLSWVRTDQRDVSEPLREADLALYRSKARGRGVVTVFDDSLRTEALQRLAHEQHVRMAVERGALHVHLQPVVDQHTGTVVGAEALLRVQQSDGARVLPPYFIQLAEELGLLPEIDLFVLQTCASWLAARATGSAPPALTSPTLTRLTVNVSPRTLRSAGFLPALQAALEQVPSPGPRLALEVTESDLLDGEDAFRDILGRARALGAEVGLDDFGTGHSSLARLRSVPLDFLKLDRSFITELDDNGTGLAVVRAVLDLAAALNLDVIAEGVESVQQAEQLRGLGCRLAQGWLYGRPQPATRQLGATRAPVPVSAVPAPRSA